MATPLQHPRQDVVSGDTWKIYGDMQDDRGQPLDVTSLVSLIRWILVGQGNVRLVDIGDAEITAVDADQGNILITVDESVTVDVPPGRYTDFCWFEMPDGRRTKWFGEFFVHAGPPPIP